MYNLVCFDLDGVLVDACEWHRLALNRAMQEVVGFELSLEEHNIKFNGLPTRKKLQMLDLKPEIIGNINLLKQKYTKEFILELCKVDKEKQELLTYLQDRYIDLFCVTNSIKQTANLMLAKAGIDSFFNFGHNVISNEDIINPKPCSEGYIRAMIETNSYPQHTLIIEDSDHGYTAAINTGAKVLKVKNATEVNLKLFHENNIA